VNVFDVVVVLQGVQEVDGARGVAAGERDHVLGHQGDWD
jgi:hypothetical protein